jgi:hypothetical protein
MYNRQPKKAAIFFVAVITLLVVTINIPGLTSQLLASSKPTVSAIGPGTVSAITYDPNRGARIATLNYAGGEKRYIIAPAGLTVGQRVLSGPDAGGSNGFALVALLLEVLSLLLLMTTFMFGLVFWYDAMHDARRTAQEINGERQPAGRWWWFHR